MVSIINIICIIACVVISIRVISVRVSQDDVDLPWSPDPGPWSTLDPGRHYGEKNWETDGGTNGGQSKREREREKESKRER